MVVLRALGFFFGRLRLRAVATIGAIPAKPQAAAVRARVAGGLLR